MIEEIKAAYRTALHNVSTSISRFVVSPGVDFSRNRKLGDEKVLNYLVTNGGESSKDELLDLCAGMDTPPSVQAMVRQRAKLLPSGVRQLLLEFQICIEETVGSERMLFYPAAGGCSAADTAVLASRTWEAVDGSVFVFSSDHRYAGE